MRSPMLVLATMYDDQTTTTYHYQFTMINAGAAVVTEGWAGLFSGNAWKRRMTVMIVPIDDADP